MKDGPSLEAFWGNAQDHEEIPLDTRKRETRAGMTRLIGDNSTG